MPASGGDTRKSTRTAGNKNIKNDKNNRKWELARMEIPAIGLDAMVKERKGSWRWTTGVAREPGSALPGEEGNCIIAAHRNMWDATFAKLPRLKPGHQVILTTPKGKYTYVVETSRKIHTSDTTPLHDTPYPRITLYTCVLPYKADERWVVQGRLADPASDDS
jgi:sortase A